MSRRRSGTRLLLRLLIALLVVGALAAALVVALAGPAAGPGQTDGRAVDRRRQLAARHRPGLGRRRREDLAALALRMVPLVGPGAADPRRQLRGRDRRHAAPAAADHGARARSARDGPPARGHDAARVARRAGQGAAPEAIDRHAGRCRADGRDRRPGRGRRRALLPRHLRLQPRRQRPHDSAPVATRRWPGTWPRPGKTGRRTRR